MSEDCVASTSRLGRIIGVMLLLHLATGLIVPYVLLQPLTKLPVAFLDVAAGMSSQVRLNVLLLFVGGAIPLGISIVAWPAVRERGYSLGLWLLALALVNFALQIVENGHWLTMLSVSQAYAEGGAADAALFRSLGIVVRSAWKWAHYSHILVVVCWIFTLYWLLFRRALVLRTLAAIGMVTCVLQVTGITLPAFAGYRMPFPALFGIPLGLANLALSVWLMAKGFKEPYGTPRAETLGIEAPSA